MTTRSWIGGFNGNDIYAGANWSPAGTPAIGDTLNMRSGIASMSGGNLFGDTLSINTDTSSAQPYSATVDLSGNAVLSALASHTAPVQQQVTFNVVGKATLHLQEQANTLASTTVTENIAPHSTLTGYSWRADTIPASR